MSAWDKRYTHALGVTWHRCKQLIEDVRAERQASRVFEDDLEELKGRRAHAGVNLALVVDVLGASFGVSTRWPNYRAQLEFYERLTYEARRERIFGKETTDMGRLVKRYGGKAECGALEREWNRAAFFSDVAVTK